MTNPKALQIGTFIFSLVAALTAGAAFLKVSGQQAGIDSAVSVSEKVLSQFARVKPWAFSREELLTAMQDANIIGAINELQGTGGKAANAKKEIDFSERRYGDPGAQFTFTEYSDFECSYCKTFFDVPKALVDGSRGNISLVFKHVPIHGEASRKEAFASECAAHQGGNDAFYKMAGAIFDDTQSNGNGTKSPLAKLANDIGLNGQDLTKCIDENLFYEKVKSDFSQAMELGIKVTPSTVVRHNQSGKETIITGAVTPNDLLKAMSELIQK